MDGARVECMLYNFFYIFGIDVNLLYLFITSFLNGNFGSWDDIVLDNRMINESWIGKDMEWSGLDLLFEKLPMHLPVGTGGIVKTINQDSQFVGWDLNLGSPTYKALDCDIC
jgi:hypothetical protein